MYNHNKFSILAYFYRGATAVHMIRIFIKIYNHSTSETNLPRLTYNFEHDFLYFYITVAVLHFNVRAREKQRYRMEIS